MKTTYFRNDSLAILLVGGAIMCTSATAFAEHYGRAGGRVGVAAIEEIVRNPRGAAAQSDNLWIVFGQAGQPVGADAIAYVNKHAKRSRFNDERAAAWFGRSGGAIGIERAREDVAMRFADQSK